MIFDLLYKWQQEIVKRFAFKQSFGLFLDMGLGKTPISLGFAEHNNCRKVIVITINSKANESVSVNGSWLNWASKSKFDYQFINKFNNVDDFDASKPELLITNYEALFKRNNSLALKEFLLSFIEHCADENVAIIVDESHKLKTIDSKQTKAIFLLKRLLMANHANVYCYLLTGTPFTTGYIDVYSQLKFLGADINKTQFKDRFCIMGNINGLLTWQQPIVGYKNIDQLYRLIHGYALTVKSEEIIDLPEQVFVDHKLPKSHNFDLETIERLPILTIEHEVMKRKISSSDYDVSQLTGLKKANNPFYRNIAFPDLSWLAETTGTFWLRARQISIGFQGSESSSKWFDYLRLNALKQFLEDNPDNYVLFYNFTPELQLLYPMLHKLGYNVDVYCGSIKSLSFYEAYEKTPESKRILNNKNVILANFASGSTGMNWQEYHKCIIFSLPLYKDYAQAIKRVHRIGQKETVIYHRFYQDNWLDNGMIKALNEQITYSEDLFKADLERVNKVILDNLS